MELKRRVDQIFNQMLCDCQLYVRENLMVVDASEYYYDFVGEKSYLPIHKLLHPEDGIILQQAALKFTRTVEMITGITGGKEKYSTIYLRMEKSNHTENGVPLLSITLFDIRGLENRNIENENKISKYRRYMSLCNQYYFEYTSADKRFIIYKYVNDKAMLVHESSLQEFCQSKIDNQDGYKINPNSINRFKRYLENEKDSFELDIDGILGEEGRYQIKGGTIYKYANMVTGVIVPMQMTMQESYYLTPAARDAGTGLLNKKAIAEYITEKLNLHDDKKRWVIIMDIDDFKCINDNYGHLFGDEVIRKVADTLKQVIGIRGVIGRFGGDEFLVLFEEAVTRESIKTILKTISKKLYYVFDPKFNITCSTGVTVYPNDGMNYEELLGKADKALYIAKEKGKNRHIIFDEKIHGSYDKDNVMINTVKYSVSKEMRTAAINDVMTNLYNDGVKYLKKKRVQNRLREVFDLDGISIFSNYGKSVICRSGDYVVEAPDATVGFVEDSFLNLFDSSGVFVDSNMLKLKAGNMAAYEVAKKQETGATIMCIGRREGTPYSMITFDVFNRNRKWSDSDVEMLSLIGCFLNNILVKES